MEALYREVLIKLRGMWMHRKLGVAVAWSLGLALFVAISAMPDRYEASARIFVNTDSILKPLMTGLTVQPNEEQRIVMLSRVVISRPNVEKLVQQVGLDAGVKSRDQRERIIDRTLRTLEFKGAGRENLYRLSFRDEDPDVAKRAIDLLASMFIESSKGGKTDDTLAAKKFIDDQVGIYEHKLQEAESRLKDFRIKYLGLAPGDGRDFFARIGEVERTLNQARLELREAENMRDAYRARIQAETSSAANPASAPSAVLVEIDARIDAQRRNIEAMLQRYTEAHPDVQAAQRVIRDLEAQKQQVMASPSTATLPAAPRALAALDALKVSIAQTDATIAQLRTRVGEYQERYNKLKASAALVPQLEAEHAQLNRDYEVNKKNYESLVARRESVNISGDMQAVAGVSDFRLVDPPRVTPRPVSPNRRILFPLALFLSIAAGLGAAYVASQVRSSFYDAKAVREATGLPVLGVVSLVMNDENKSATRRTALRFAGAAAGLVMTYVTGLLVFELILSRAT
ncbi:MAG: XrtA system polysaccharide chain length determinant [Betaproteobacteria bacterium]